MVMILKVLEELLSVIYVKEQLVVIVFGIFMFCLLIGNSKDPYQDIVSS